MNHNVTLCHRIYVQQYEGQETFRYFVNPTSVCVTGKGGRQRGKETQFSNAGSNLQSIMSSSSVTMKLESLPGKMRDKFAMSVASLISSLTVYSTLREVSNLRLTDVSARSAPSTTDSSPLNVSSGPSAPFKSCARRSFPAVAVLQ